VGRRILPVLSFFLIVIVVAVPVDLALQFLGTPQDRLINTALSTALALVFGSLGLVVSRGVALLTLLPLLVTCVFVRLIYGAIVHFSGQGFGHEVFVHLDPESFRILWHEYDRLVYRAVGVCLFTATAFWLVIRKQPRASRVKLPTLGVTVASTLVLMLGRNQMPEWQLWQAWTYWQQTSIVASPEQTRDSDVGQKLRDFGLRADVTRWNSTSLIETDLPTTDEIWAETGEQPRNLILLYVEALSQGIIEHPSYPELMPNFRSLILEHGWIQELHTSSFVTIEGVANTQCGLLFPFRGHGSGFAGRTILAQALPCLGDVLSEAGYHQTYILGGGPLSFTGKGSFLAAHGYDDLRGWEYWESHGHQRAPGHWGMGDVETLKQVRLAVAERHRKDRPFNVTSLTVGSHIPGYSYETCETFRDGSDRYLDALHCTDQIVGDWIKRLEVEGLLENTLLVIVGDHPLFSNPAMYELFGDAVHDTRLPLIVIGDDLKMAQHARGGGFDLAPTLLDLLGIRHNAEFAMGRSLASPHNRPDYLVTRRHDIHQGAPVRNSPQKCGSPRHDVASESPPTLPLSPCEKRNLLDLLRELSRVYSAQPEPIDCGAQQPAFVRVPAGRIGPVTVKVNGEDWSNRFTWRGRMTHPTEPGLFALGLDSRGRPSAAAFLPAETIADTSSPKLPEDVDAAHAALIAWRPPDRAAVDLSSVAPSLPSEQRNGAAWLIKLDEESALASQTTADGQVIKLLIDKKRCKEITIDPT
jgi:hypothetical protein